MCGVLVSAIAARSVRNLDDPGGVRFSLGDAARHERCRHCNAENERHDPERSEEDDELATFPSAPDRGGKDGVADLE
jgi:hypothetical protein